MNRNLKRILPILLAIVVLCSVVWYLFVYDRDFTRDTLVKHARYFEQQGNHNLAAWFYDRAYIYSGESDEVAIEFAQQFVSMGNYTKAERTLSQAIADGASVDLYVALCNTYVQQDKLKDAVTMLASITDPEIKDKLESMRPAAPTVDIEPGFYNQYMDIHLQCTDGTLFYTTDLSYPSTRSSQNSNVVTLAGGENTIRAIAVNELGLVSPVTVFGYTVKGVIEPVTLQDPAVDAAVRQKLQLGADATIYSRDLWAITEFNFPSNALSSSDLALMPYIQVLTVENSSADGWESLSALTDLTQLTMNKCSLSANAIQAIGTLPKLEKLVLTNSNLSNIDGLANLKTVTHLDLSNNTVRNLGALSGFTNLTYLDLSHNALEDISSLSALTRLEHLDISFNSLTSVATLTACTSLLDLNIQNNAIAALTGLEGMTKLTKLNASYNAITDIIPLGTCIAITELDISNNQLTKIHTVTSMKGLQFLNFSRNAVTTIPAFASTSPLVTIDGSYNEITTVSVLSNLHQLNKVLMDYNSISNVDSLANCHSLTVVSVYGNPVWDVSALTASGIIVTYTPET